MQAAHVQYGGHGSGASGLGAHGGWPGHVPTADGFSQSRRASPTRLMPTTKSPRNAPGNTATHQAMVSEAWPSDTIWPHSGVGGCTPRPRNPSAAIHSIAMPSHTVVWTMTAGIAPGSTCRTMMWPGPAPSARDARTYGRFRISLAAPSTMRAYSGTETMATAMTALTRLG